VLRLLIFWGAVLRLHSVRTETGVSHLQLKARDPGRWDGKAGEDGESVPVLRSSPVLYSRSVNFNERYSLESTEMSSGKGL